MVGSASAKTWSGGMLWGLQSRVRSLDSKGPVTVCPASGAMSPRWNDAMRGAFAGLSMNHGDAHLARAVLEGCAYALRDLVDRLDRWLHARLGDAGALLAITHAPIVRAAIVATLAAPPEACWRIDVPPLSTTELVSDGRRWTWRPARSR